MRKESRENILISEPNASNEMPYFPYMWAVLKSFCERREGVGDHFNWLEPIRRKSNPVSLLRPYKGIPVDVLGLSCYLWNWDLQKAIGRQVRSQHPECLIVVGGPEPEYSDPDFFVKNPEVDVAVPQDGEMPFAGILERVKEGRRDFRDIPGLHVHVRGTGENMFTGQAAVLTRFDYSPYTEQSAYFETLTRSAGQSGFNAVWETNRGCPYGCSYCYWGSNTMSKVRKFDMGRVKAEAEWFGRLNVNCVLLADANFGILPRDVEIVDFIAESRRQHGFPRTLFYCSAKNNPKRNIEIAKKVSKSGISSVFQVPFQHTREEVLASIDRRNISIENERKAAYGLMDEGILFNVAILLGLPGDTYDSWKSCLADVMEWGIHDNYTILPFILLPNSPAAERSYIARYGIETVRSCAPTNVGSSGRLEKNSSDRLISGRIIVRTNSFSKEDWVRMKTYATFVKALHNCGLTQFVALYLRFTHNIPYKVFYEEMIENFAVSEGLTGDWYRKILKANEEVLREENALEYFDIDVLPDLPFRLEGYQWVFVNACMSVDLFFAELESSLARQYPSVENLKHAIAFQKEVIILPHYDREKGKEFQTDLNWVEYLNKARGLTAYEPLEEPRSVPGARIRIDDKDCGKSFAKFPLDWDPHDGKGSWADWMDRTLFWHRTSSRTIHQDMKLLTPCMMESAAADSEERS